MFHWAGATSVPILRSKTQNTGLRLGLRSLGGRPHNMSARIFLVIIVIASAEAKRWITKEIMFMHQSIYASCIT